MGGGGQEQGVGRGGEMQGVSGCGEVLFFVLYVFQPVFTSLKNTIVEHILDWALH